MLTSVASLFALATVSAALTLVDGSLPVPGTNPVAALTNNLPAQAQWYQQQLQHQQLQVNWAAQQVGAAWQRKKRSLPIPGTNPVAALTTNLPAQAQWYQQQQQHQQLLVNWAAQQVGAAWQRKKRSLPVPGTNPVAALTYNLPAQAQWYQQQQQHQQLLVNWAAQQAGAAWQRKKRSLPAPGTNPVAALTYNLPAQAQWYQQQQQHQQLLVNWAAQQAGAAWQRKKRSLPAPGTNPVAALTHNLPAQAQWYQQQQQYQQLLVNWAAQQVGAAWQRKKRSLPAPGTNPVAALTYNLPAQAQWYQQQQQHQQLLVNWAAQQAGAAWQ